VFDVAAIRAPPSARRAISVTSDRVTGIVQLEPVDADQVMAGQLISGQCETQRTDQVRVLTNVPNTLVPGLACHRRQQVVVTPVPPSKYSQGAPQAAAIGTGGADGATVRRNAARGDCAA
jgi:hypothetical protein